MASVEELLDAFDYINGHVENEACLCLKTGKIYFYSELSDDAEPLPDDIDSAERYAAIPDSRDLGLGKPLVFRFVAPRYLTTYGRWRRSSVDRARTRGTKTYWSIAVCSISGTHSSARARNASCAIGARRRE